MKNFDVTNPELKTSLNAQQPGQQVAANTSNAREIKIFTRAEFDKFELGDLFEKLDTNKDNKLSADEIKPLDKNGDGVVTDSEIEQYNTEHPAAAIVETVVGNNTDTDMDVDNDDTIEGGEATDDVPEEIAGDGADDSVIETASDDTTDEEVVVECSIIPDDIKDDDGIVDLGKLREYVGITDEYSEIDNETKIQILAELLNVKIEEDANSGVEDIENKYTEILKSSLQDNINNNPQEALNVLASVKGVNIQQEAKQEIMLLTLQTVQDRDTQNDIINELLTNIDVYFAEDSDNANNTNLINQIVNCDNPEYIVKLLQAKPELSDIIYQSVSDNENLSSDTLSTVLSYKDEVERSKIENEESSNIDCNNLASEFTDDDGAVTLRNAELVLGLNNNATYNSESTDVEVKAAIFMDAFNNLMYDELETAATDEERENIIAKYNSTYKELMLKNKDSDDIFVYTLQYSNLSRAEKSSIIADRIMNPIDTESNNRLFEHIMTHQDEYFIKDTNDENSKTILRAIISNQDTQQIVRLADIPEFTDFIKSELELLAKSDEKYASILESINQTKAEGAENCSDDNIIREIQQALEGNDIDQVISSFNTLIQQDDKTPAQRAQILMSTIDYCRENNIEIPADIWNEINGSIDKFVDFEQIDELFSKKDLTADEQLKMNNFKQTIVCISMSVNNDAIISWIENSGLNPELVERVINNSLDYNDSNLSLEIREKLSKLSDAVAHLACKHMANDISNEDVDSEIKKQKMKDNNIDNNLSDEELDEAGAAAGLSDEEIEDLKKNRQKSNNIDTTSPEPTSTTTSQSDNHSTPSYTNSNSTTSNSSSGTQYGSGSTGTSTANSSGYADGGQGYGTSGGYTTGTAGTGLNYGYSGTSAGYDQSSSFTMPVTTNPIDSNSPAGLVSSNNDRALGGLSNLYSERYAGGVKPSDIEDEDPHTIMRKNPKFRQVFQELHQITNGKRINQLDTKGIFDVIKFLASGKLNSFHRLVKIFTKHINNHFTRMSVDNLCNEYVYGEAEIKDYLKENRFVTTPILIGYFSMHRAELAKAPDAIRDEIQEYQEKNMRRYENNIV